MQLKLVFQAFSALFLFLLAYVFTENLNIVLIENWLWKQENLCLIRLHSHVVNRTKGTKLVEYFKTQHSVLHLCLPCLKKLCAWIMYSVMIKKINLRGQIYGFTFITKPLTFET